MPNTPRLQLPFPETNDTADVPRDVKALAERIEALTQWIRQTDFAAGVGVLSPGDLKFSAAPFVAGPSPLPWLPCDGSAVSRAVYADLYAALGGASSAWGQGDGSTTFNLPDLRGRVPMGSGLGAPIGGIAMTPRALGQLVGEEVHKLTLPEIADHNHSFTDDAPYSTGSRNFGAGSGGPTLYDGIQGLSKVTFAMTTPGGAVTARDQPHNNVGPSAVVVVLIKT